MISPIRTSRFCSYSFSILSGGNIAFLREEGGTRSVTEGARVTLVFNKFYRNALSLTRLRRELPPGGSLWFVRSESLSAFPDKHCFCGHKSDKHIVLVELFFWKLKYLVIESLESYVIILLNRFKIIMKGMIPKWI